MSPRVSVRQAIAAALFCALPLSFQSHAGVGIGAIPVPQDVQSDRLIIRFKDNIPFDKVNEVLKQLERQQGKKPEFVRETVNNAMVFKFEKAKGRSEWAQLQRFLRSTNTVDYAEVDELLQPMTTTPDDDYFHYQWPLTEAIGGINVQSSWEQGISGTATVVAIIDTGYRPHTDLMPNLIAGYDMIGDTFVANDGDGRDSDASDPGDYVLAGECGSSSNINSSWHGTHVAGTVAAAANNQSGIAGVAYDAKIQSVRTLGKCGGYTSDIADSVLWASGNAVSGTPGNVTPARVLNLSLGGSGSCSRTMQRAIDSAVAKNSVVVVAAGNSNADAGQFTPANCQNVITVASTSREGGKAYYSNYGEAVDVAAPGGSMLSSGYDGILSTLNTGSTTPASDTYAFYQGTSMAAPHVSGVAALMLSANPDLTPGEVETIIKDNARPFPAACSGCGAGIVDASAAVSMAISLSDGDTDPVNTAPNASFTSAISNLNVQFSDTSSDADGPLASWQWSFGDGSVSATQNPGHTYAAAGTYYVTLTVADDEGVTDSYSQSVTVSEASAQTISLSVKAYKVRGRQKVDLTWSGATSSKVDIYRDGVKQSTTKNDGAATDAINRRGGGSYTYEVCEAGTVTCSDSVTANF